MKKHKISYLYKNSQISDKKTLFFCSWSSYVFFPIAIEAEGIAKAPAPNPMSEEVIKFSQDEDMYQGTLSWQGSKASTKFNYDKPKKNR